MDNRTVSIDHPKRFGPIFKGETLRTHMKLPKNSSLVPSLTFSSHDDVLAFAQRCVVPFHIDGRKAIHTENWILSRYLLACADARLLTYPFTAIHAEESQSPDFILVGPTGIKTGVEITEASTPEFHIELIKIERAIDNHYDVRPGWMADQAERQWAIVVFDAIQRKSSKLAKGGWNPADAYDLVIYDNGPAPVFDFDQAREFLVEHLISSDRSGFRTTSLITSGAAWLVYDIEGECGRFPIRPVLIRNRYYVSGDSLH